MERRELKLRLNSPAFLGNASQQAQWRTPPLKALLRFWWRIAVAKEVSYSVNDLRSRELALFGSAGGVGAGSGRSRVRIRLNDWRVQEAETWSANNRLIGKVAINPKQPRPGAKPWQVPADAYLGFGALVADKQGHVSLDRRKSERTALQDSAEAAITVEWSATDETPALNLALQLINQFGSIGGRANNGWGSLSVNGPAEWPLRLTRQTLIDLEDCDGLEFPAGIGVASKSPLIWETPDWRTTWEEAITDLAYIRRALREECRERPGHPKGELCERHLTGYPVNEHAVSHWSSDFRFPDQIRFKVMRSADGYWGRIYHLPHDVPRHTPKRQEATALLRRSWEICHDWLDTQIGKAEVRT